MEGVLQALDALLAESIAALEDDDVAGRLIALRGVKAQLAAYEAKLTSAFDTAGAFRHDGSRSMVVWLVRNCGVSRTAARAQVRLAKRLRTMPATRAALEAGDITEEHAVALGRLAHSLRRPVRDAFPEAETCLVDQAKDLPFRDFETVSRYWEDLVDPDGTESQADDDYDARHLHASEMLRGVVRIDGTMDPVGGAIVLGELTRLERAMFEADWARAEAEHGAGVRPEDLWRTPAQRRADALAEMARRSANAATDSGGGSDKGPLFVVHIGPDVPARMCELGSGRVIAPGLLVPWLGKADIERIVYGPGKRVIELSKRDRFFRGGLRRAIQLRDRFCSTPGCDVPGEFCDVDHIKPHSQGGETTQENGRLKCGCDNRWAFQHEQCRPTSGPDPPDTG